MNNHLSPHDRFFRSAMTNPKVVREFFAAHLPDRIKNIVDFNSIQLQKDSYIDDNLRMQVTDLLFFAKFNQHTGYFYLLVEHQSTPQKLMPFRILKYMIRIFEQHLKTTRNKHLPIVYPMLFYNGRNSYNYSTNLFDLFGENKKLAKEIFLQPTQLIDLTKIPDADFKHLLWYGTLAKTMKHIFAKEFLPILRELIQNLRNIENNGNFSYINSILSYIIEAGEVRDEPQFREIIQTGLTKVDEEQIMTLAELYMQRGLQKGILQGREKGREEGREEGKLEGKLEGKQEALRSVIKALMQADFTVDKIAKFTNLSISEVNRLKEHIH